jgi:GntR family transcriptional regulator of vanillate catabolism
LFAHRRGDVDSQTGRAFVEIRELLLRGEFPRGERISEIPLGQRLGMSRTPIRLALERLAHMGLLDVGSTGGFTVREFTIAEVRDAIELRGILEGAAARLAAERLTSDKELAHLYRFREDVNSHTELSMDSFPGYMDHNEAFHAAIVDLAKSDMLSRLLRQANSLPFASPSAMVFPTSILPSSEETLTIAREQHRGIVEAIRDREGTRAEHLAREHARLAWKVLEAALGDKQALSSVPGGSLINLSS